MTDLLAVLPDMDLKPFSHLTHSLEKNAYTVADLIVLDPSDIARDCPLPLSDLKNLIETITQELKSGVVKALQEKMNTPAKTITASQPTSLRRISMLEDVKMIKTLDARMDDALGGGFASGHITEIAGESSVGKTQLVLGLLLSVQLRPPLGLSRSSMYISTEVPLNTKRLFQILSCNPIYLDLPASRRPSLDAVFCIPVNDIEVQEHIVEFQLPLAVKKHNIGLIVIDSVAANYRAEYTTQSSDLSDRAWDLGKLGKILRRVAQEDNVAIVVTNQVSDRLDKTTSRMSRDLLRFSSSACSSSPAPQTPSQSTQQEAMIATSQRDPGMSLDHQQRFFTGWNGQSSDNMTEDTKTPALGLAWANQFSARVVLKMEIWPAIYPGGHIWHDRQKQRSLSVVFAPWAPSNRQAVEYEIRAEGVVSVEKQGTFDEDSSKNTSSEFHDVNQGAIEDATSADPGLLDPALWGLDGAEEDQEYPC